MDIYIYIWWFSKIGVPPVIIHFWMGFFHSVNHPFLDIPMNGNPHMLNSHKPSVDLLRRLCYRFTKRHMFHGQQFDLPGLGGWLAPIYGGFHSHGGTPKSSSISNDGIFPNKNHYFGVALFMETPIYKRTSSSRSGPTLTCSWNIGPAVV